MPRWTEQELQAYLQRRSIAPGHPQPPVTCLFKGESKDEARLNKTEKAFLEKLRQNAPLPVMIQALTFKLADDCRYTPDFATIVPHGPLICYEVKGFMRDDAFVKLKVAARTYPWVHFYLVRKNKSGSGSSWSETRVEP